MFQKKYKNKKRISVNLIVSLSLILAVLLPVLTPSYASAAIKKVSDQRDRTILYALIRCIDPDQGPDLDGNWTQHATGEDIRAGNMSGLIASGSYDGDAAVGYEIDEEDGNANCDQMSLTRAMRPIGKTPKWFFDQYYDLEHIEDLGDQGFGYPYREGVTDQDVLSKIRNLMKSRDLDMGRDERLRRLATAFWVCAEVAPDPPDRDTSTFGGKKYQLRSDAPGHVSIGYDFPNGDPNDGKFECNTLIKWGDKDEMAAALSAHGAGSTPGSVGGADSTGSLTDCDTKLLNPLSWIVCPLIDIGSDASDYIFQNVAAPLLEDVPIELNANDGAYSAWQGFRFIANIMIIGTMLVIVYVQARGGPS